MNSYHSSVMDSNNPYKVIIIGAGISGLSAANFLYRNGIEDILVLEAKEKAGGRIQTKEFGSGENNKCGLVELGAQWIHGEDNDLCRLVKASNHRHEKFSWEGKGDFLLPNGEKTEESIITEVLDWLESTSEYVENSFSIQDIQDGSSQEWGSKPSMGWFLKTEFLKYLEDLGYEEGSMEYDLRLAIFQWGMSFQRIDNSCNQMTDLSLFRWSEFEINPGEHYNNFKEGASTFVDKVLITSLPKNTIILNSPVEKVSWDKEVVELHTRSGKTFPCHSVIVTCSIGVLKEIHKNLFNPRLPSNVSTAIESTGFGPVTKIFLKWDKPWWPDGFQGLQFLWPKDFINCCDDENSENAPIHEINKDLMEKWPKSITGFDPVLDNPNVLLGWLGGPEAVFVESLKESEIGNRCAKLLRDYTKLNVPDPDAVLVSKWNTDEFIRGAYSNRAVEGDQVPGDISNVLSEPVIQYNTNGTEKPVILFAGEALSKAQYSTLHGAFETGEMQAAKLVKYIKSLEASSTLDFPKDLNHSIQFCSAESSISLSCLDEICSLCNKLSQKVSS